MLDNELCCCAGDQWSLRRTLRHSMAWFHEFYQISQQYKLHSSTVRSRHLSVNSNEQNGWYSPSWTLWSRGVSSWLSTSSSAACFPSHHASTICYQRREASVTHRLRLARTFEPLTIRTVKYRNSFIPYCLSNFDYLDIFSLHLSLMHRI